LSGDESTTIRVKVYARSSRSRVEAMDDGTFRVYVSAAPEKGKANAQVVKCLAKHLGVKSSSVEIISGATSRLKIVRILA
jgi:uncharacterized protein (TIGR00251 family)